MLALRPVDKFPPSPRRVGWLGYRRNDVKGALRVQLGFDTSTWGEVTVVALSGDLDLAAVPAFHQQIVGLVAGGARRVVLDLGALDFLDSVGLGLVVSALKRVRGSGGDLAVACAEPRILKPFELTGLLQALAVVPTVEAAVQRLGE
jgi:anti-sigma B factor antagonist